MPSSCGFSRFWMCIIPYQKPEVILFELSGILEKVSGPTAAVTPWEERLKVVLGARRTYTLYKFWPLVTSPSQLKHSLLRQKSTG